MTKSILIFVHLGSFALSFGLVLFCDFLLSRVLLTGRVGQKEVHLIALASKVIFRSLVVLIASGIGFLIYYKFHDPLALLNPKLYAKMTVVTVLSCNGYWLHKRGLSYLAAGLDNDLRLSPHIFQLKKLMISGALSAISWWTAFVFGTFKELNFMFTFTQLILAYTVLIFSAWLGIEGLFAFFRYLQKPTSWMVKEVKRVS